MGERQSDRIVRITHYFRVQPSCIGLLDDRVIKVVWIALVAVLQIMKITQEIERERRQGLVGRCGEPASAKDLCVLWNAFSHVTTSTVANNETVNA